jgi:hypothetical protein
MGAYELTVMQLSGPAIVLLFAMALTLVVKKAQPLLQRHNVKYEVSFFATCCYVILLIFFRRSHFCVLAHRMFENCGR